MVYLCAVLFGLLMVGLDQLTKYLVVSNMAYGQSTVLVDKVLNLTYIHNKGAVFGFFENQRWLLLSFSAIILAVCIGLLIKKAFKSRMMYWAICLVLAGGVGNMIDRIFRGYVVDFIDVQFMDFYIFNIADCCVVIGVLLILIYFIVDTIRDYRLGRRISTEESGE